MFSFEAEPSPKEKPSGYCRAESTKLHHFLFMFFFFPLIFLWISLDPFSSYALLRMIFNAFRLTIRSSYSNCFQLYRQVENTRLSRERQLNYSLIIFKQLKNWKYANRPESQFWVPYRRRKKKIFSLIQTEKLNQFCLGSFGVFLFCFRFYN